MSQTGERTGSATEDPGLTSAEVEALVAAGKTNVDTNVKTKSVGAIVREHTCTLFNGVNAALALLVLTTGSLRNLLFVWVVIANLVIGVVQELRSKATVDRLSVLAAHDVRVRRDGEVTRVPSAGVVLGDLLVLGRGEQVPVDAEVVSGEASLNESLLTGESTPLPKAVGDQLMSGSFIDSGTLVARVTRVGAESYAARINAEAKYVKTPNSEIMATLRAIIRLATYLLAPLGVGLFLRTFLTGETLSGAILTTVAAVVGMIPQGLVLLTSTVLAIATIRLARQKVLIQQFYCIETLARVDVLCLDKTGTITSGAMEVERCEAVVPSDGPGALEGALSTLAHAQDDDANETAAAILSYVDGKGVSPMPTLRCVPFSSSRKYSGCVTADGCLVMGAAQFVMGDASADVSDRLRSFGPMSRVLVVCSCDGFDDEGLIEGDVRLLGFVAIRDQIRPNAAKTISYFCEQGVALNVISGDDPATVSAIASHVGVPGAERWVDATTLDSPERLAASVGEYHVFGRVTPQQKRDLLRALKEQGHTVAMTGDGVNDVLALKDADCSGARASGSDAARNSAAVVLVANDFAHMPEVVAEGRRSINTLQRSASLFLVKTLFSAVLALVCIVNPPYPFLPIQMSLISAAIIGVPSFVLALEPNHERVTGDFLVNVLCRSIPAAIVVSVAVAVTTCTSGMTGFSYGEVSTLCLMITATVGLCLIARISSPLNPLRCALLAVCIAMVLGGCTVARDFFEVSYLTFQMWVFLAVTLCVGLVAFNLLYDRFARSAEAGTGLMRLVSDLEEKYARARS
ncbi:MAG: HAD-IC family P-type ATPase [Atopobiaceae bacterium]|nr:HAD-IC family P-type ATPase [Atopobiaceae bacterium]